MRNSKIYYFIQLSIGVISLIAFYHFTLPNLIKEDMPLVKVEDTKPVVTPDLGETLEKTERKVTTSKRYYGGPTASREPISPRRNVVNLPREPSSKPSNPTVHKRIVTPESLENTNVSEVPTKPDPVKLEVMPKTELPKVFDENVSFWDNYYINKIERFFKFTSTIIGTVSPLIGFAMSYLLWRERRKEQKTQTV